MKKKEIVRLILMPVAFVAVVLFALLMPTGARYASADDILSIQVASANGRGAALDARADIEAFVEWLNKTVPPAEMHFVRETDEYTLDEADWSMVATQTPDQMRGIDIAEPFTYSIYRMYIYVTGDALYYNGILYDIAPDAVRGIDTLLNGWMEGKA